VHNEFIPPGQNVNGHYYVQVLQRLRYAVRRKLRDKWQAGTVVLHHDNAPSHTALVVQQFLAEKNIPVITQPQFSPDLAPHEFWLMPTLKIGLRRAFFATMEDIKSNATAELWKIPKEAFRRCLQQ
jgi:transposase